ncbi:MAG TPA: ATP-binding protein [Candidatus Binatia bacterium]
MGKFDSVKLLATGSFLQELSRRLFVIILIAVVPILGVILYQARLARELQASEALEDAWYIVENVALREVRFIDSAKQLLSLLAETSELANGNTEQCSRFLKRIVEHNQVYVDLGIADLSGNVLCRAHDFEWFSENLSRSPHFRSALTTRTFAIGDFQVHGQTGRKGVNFAYPIVNSNGQVESVIFAALDVNWITQLAAENNLPEGGALTIVDSKGTMLARFPEPEKWAGKHIPDAALFELLQLRSQSSKELVGLDGVDRLYAFKPISLARAAGQIYVMIGIPKEVVFGPVNHQLARNLMLLLLVSLLATAVAWLVGSKFVIDFVKIRAEAEEARAQLAAIVQSSEDAIIGITLDGVITAWNDGAEAMHGYSAAEVCGRAITMVIPQDRHGEIPELLGIIKLGKGINRYESERVTKDGRKFYVSASLSPIRNHFGAISGASTITRDITVLRRGEEQLLAHTARLETLQLVAHDVAGTLSMNEVLSRALSRLVSESGFDFAFVHFSNEVGGQKFYGASFTPCCPDELATVWHGLGDEFIECAWECRNPWFIENAAATPELQSAAPGNAIRALAVLPLTRETQFSAVLTLLCARPRRFGIEDSQFLQTVARQIAMAVDNAWLFEGTMRANTELRREVEERKRAERTLADFTAMVAHDLRSPLSNVVSIIDSLGDGLFGAVTELQQKWLWKTESNCRSLIQHVSDFLDVSKIDAGRLKLVKRPVDVASLLCETLQDFSMEANKKKITLRSEIPSVLPSAAIDRQRINQVLQNLLSNALKFTEPGGFIEIGAGVQGDSTVVVRVKDNGIGIAEDEIDLIFDIYRQAQQGENSHRGGTGLGLTICKKIIEAHGGNVWVESEPGKGSTFFFAIPAKFDSPEMVIPA